MANIDKILALADAIEAAAAPDANPKIGFNMADYVGLERLNHDRTGHDCGTTACIAGWAVFLEYGINELVGAGHTGRKAADILGLSDAEADAMFTPSGLGVSYHSIQPHHAVEMLRRYAKTGAVVWPDVVARFPSVDKEA